MCNPWSHRDSFEFVLVLLSLLQQAVPRTVQVAPTKALALVCDINSGRRVDVPALEL